MTPSPPAASVLYARLIAKGRLRHLQLLVSIAEFGSTKRAAEQVGLSQPAATQALSDIERLLGMALFERHARGMRLTQAGRALIPIAKSAMDALRASADTLHALQEGASGVLRVGAIPAAVTGLLCRRLPALSSRYPSLRIEVQEDRGEHLLPEVSSGRLDLALCRRPAAVPTACRFVPLLADTPWVVASPSHPLAQQPSLTLADLRAACWLLPTEGKGVRSLFDAMFASFAERPRLHPISGTSLPLLLELLRREPLLSLVPGSLIAPFCEWGLVTRLAFEVGGEFDGLGALLGPGSDNPLVATFVQELRGEGAEGLSA